MNPPTLPHRVALACCLPLLALLIVIGCRPHSDYGEGNEPIGVAMVNFNEKLENLETDQRKMLELVREQQRLLTNLSQQTTTYSGQSAMSVASVGPDGPPTESGSEFPRERLSSDDPAIQPLELASSTPVTGAISEPYEADWYRLVVESPTIVRLEADGGEFDSVMALFGPNDIAEQIAYNDDGRGKNALIQNILPAGTYYLAVGGYTDRTGAYELKTHASPIREFPGSEQRQAAELTPDEAWLFYHLTIAEAGYYKVSHAWAASDVSTLVEARLMKLNGDDQTHRSVNLEAEGNSRVYALEAGEYYLFFDAPGLAAPQTLQVDVVPLIEARS